MEKKFMEVVLALLAIMLLVAAGTANAATLPTPAMGTCDKQAAAFANAKDFAALPPMLQNVGLTGDESQKVVARLRQLSFDRAKIVLLGLLAEGKC
jgi:hypothetical protein